MVNFITIALIYVIGAILVDNIRLFFGIIVMMMAYQIDIEIKREKRYIEYLKKLEKEKDDLTDDPGP